LPGRDDHRPVSEPVRLGAVPENQSRSGHPWFGAAGRQGWRRPGANAEGRTRRRRGIRQRKCP
jgi:hypothetical protein